MVIPVVCLELLRTSCSEHSCLHVWCTWWCMCEFLGFCTQAWNCCVLSWARPCPAASRVLAPAPPSRAWEPVGPSVYLRPWLSHDMSYKIFFFLVGFFLKNRLVALMYTLSVANFSSLCFFICLKISFDEKFLI